MQCLFKKTKLEELPLFSPERKMKGWGINVCFLKVQKVAEWARYLEEKLAVYSKVLALVETKGLFRIFLNTVLDCFVCF